MQSSPLNHIKILIMFFVLSKMFVYFLKPVIWIFIFFIIGLVTKKPRLKKYCLRISLILFILFSNTFLLNQFAKLWDVKETALPDYSTYSCAIVFGGFASEDTHQNGYFKG